MDPHRRNLALLVAAQALLFTNNVILITVNGLAGLALAAHPALATLPVTSYVVGAALATVPASLWMHRVGRRTGFVAGTGFGMLGALLGTVAVHVESFLLLCASTLVSGVYGAFGGYYRFAATESGGPEHAPRAISWVMAGGIVGGVLGPESTKLTVDLLPQRFAGAYASLVVLAAAAMLAASRLELPRLSDAERRDPGRPLAEIAREPGFVVAVVSAMVGYGVMNLLMTSTPIAMAHHHHPYPDAAFVIEWHVIAMFAPSFVTGRLIARAGVLPILATGIALMFGCIAVALAGTGMLHFWTALVLLGVGWNFMFIGGTTLLTETDTPAERAKTQGLNDGLVYATMAVSSLASGALVTTGGWHALSLASLPFLGIAAVLVAWYGTRGRRETAATGS